MRKPAPLRCAGLHNLLPVIWRLYFNKLKKLNIQFLNKILTVAFLVGSFGLDFLHSQRSFRNIVYRRPEGWPVRWAPVQHRHRAVLSVIILQKCFKFIQILLNCWPLKLSMPTNCKPFRTNILPIVLWVFETCYYQNNYNIKISSVNDKWSESPILDLEQRIIHIYITPDVIYKTEQYSL